MKVAIRTSSGPYAIGIFDSGSNLLAAKSSEREGMHQSSLVTLLQACLQEAGQSKDSIAEVIVDLGPGGLSSTRVGVSFANALSYGTRSRLFGVSALRMQAHNLTDGLADRILSIRPAPGGKCFWAYFNGPDLLESGLGLPNEIITQKVERFEGLTVVGPMKRFLLTGSYPKTEFVDLDPTSLESMLLCPKISPRPDENTCYLEPTNSASGAT